MSVSSIPSESIRYVAGGSISLLGGILLGIPIYDMWNDITELAWRFTTTVAENALLVILALSLVVGGIWLVRTDWDDADVVDTARRTWIGAILVGVLLGWAMYLQLFAMGALKPHILALDGLLIGAAATFGLSVTATSANRYEAAASRERVLNDRLELLLDVAAKLETATTKTGAYEAVSAVIDRLVGEGDYRIVIDGETVRGSSFEKEPTTTVPVGDRGRIELHWDGDRPEALTLELFGEFLAEAIQRIEREDAIRSERDILEFVNRTLRHDLMNDISLVRARLRMLEGAEGLSDQEVEHLSIALGRVEEMDEFVRTMRTYMKSILAEDHRLEAFALPPIVEEHVAKIRDSHPEAEVTVGEVPSVSVRADEMLDRVFANVLRNAIEHNNAPTPRVRVTGERSTGAVTVTVSDNGPGIPEEKRESIFDLEDRPSGDDGSGFGLYLVNDVVEGYGGSVEIRSNEPSGTVVELILPTPDDAS